MLTASVIRMLNKTLVYTNETTRRYVPEGSYLHIRLRENLKSHNVRKHLLAVGSKGKTILGPKEEKVGPS